MTPPAPRSTFASFLSAYLSILRGYSVSMTVIDMAWGMFASAMAATLAWSCVTHRTPS